MTIPPRYEIRTAPRQECFLCGTRGKNLHRGLKDYLFGAPGEWDFQVCTNPECGLVWLHPMPIEADIGKAYGTYYTHPVTKDGPQESRNTNFAKRILRHVYNALLYVTLIHRVRTRLSVMYLGKTSPGRVLDVGCGDGSRLARMRSLGWEVDGQEVDPRAAAVARSYHNIPVYLGPLHEARFPAASFDAITMNHVIEHVHEPIILLEECFRILKPGGVLILVTPNVDSYGHKRFGPHWRGLEPPRHLNLFSQKTLRKLVMVAGFRTYTSRTTAAHAELIAAGSIDISAAAARSKQTRVLRGLAIVWYQLAMHLLCLIRRNSGEECILTAAKQSG